VLTADEVPTPMQVGVGTELIIEEAAGSSFQFLVLTADHELLPCKREPAPTFPFGLPIRYQLLLQAGVGT
jgi:hypothetical protein